MGSIQEKRKKGSHYTYEERLALEYYLKGSAHFPQTENTLALAGIFGKSRRSIQREIKRGSVEHETSGVQTKFEYNADFAQQDAAYQMSAKGSPVKLGHEWALVEQIRELIVKDNYSPYAVVQHFNSTGWPSKVRICYKTLYNYINNNILPAVSIRDLPNKGITYKEKHTPKRFSRAGCALRSISKRPAWINDRSEYGHWEIDTVKSAADTSSACILTLTERKSRYEIIRKMDDGKASSVVAQLNGLEKQLGSTTFKKLFKSITADGGCEFMWFDGIERSCMDGQKRTTLYFAQPYCACQRGTNENHNRMFRRFFPKGTNFTRLTAALFIDTQNWMNNYPRRILEGASPAKVLQNYMGPDFVLPG